jgi:hypothetical protein
MAIDLAPRHCRALHRPAVALALGSALLISACWIFWHQWVKPEFFPRNFGVVKQGAIYRSAQNSPRVLRQLCAERHLKTILDLGGAAGYDARTQAQRDVAAELGIDRFEFLLPSDGTGDPDKYVQALRLMTDPARQPVLVHCGSGAQRTSTITLLYRIVVEGKTVRDAYPESFIYHHEPEEWILLAWLADNLDYIRAAYCQPDQAVADIGISAPRGEQPTPPR